MSGREQAMKLNPLLRSPNGFCWATGIENTFIPHARPGMRPLDEYELTQHYDQYELDFSLAARLGVRAIRWGIPWYRVEPEPGHFDWEWTDRALEVMVEKHRLVPILDLMHYGTPFWLEGSFASPDYPARVADYAAAVARRYIDRVQVFTPLNEPIVNADFCGNRGEWPPYLTSDAGFVTVLMSIARGIVQTAAALRAEQPGCFLVQVEALWRFWTANPAFQERIALQNERQYLCFDLTTGRMEPKHMLWPLLRSNGVTEADLQWFRENACTYDVFGANFYPWSYGEMAAEPESTAVEDVRPKRIGPPTPGGAIAEVIHDAHSRYGLPVMVTETSANAPEAGRAAWMDETINAVMDLRKQGVPVVGYTWFPMMTMIDWDYRTGTKPLADYLLHLGLYDSTFDENGILQRKPTGLAGQYRRYTQGP